MSTPAFSKFLRRWAQQKRPAAPASRRARLRVEEVEARLVPVTAPTPLAGSAQAIVGGAFNSLSFVQPSAVADPTNPDNLVMVTNNGTFMIAYASSDGGASWVPFFDNNQYNLVPVPPPGAPNPPQGYIRAFRIADPSIDPGPGFKRRDQKNYTNTTSAAAAFGRDGKVYIAAVEQNAAPGQLATSGAVVVYAFDFNGGVPQIIDLDEKLGAENVNDSFFGFTAGGYQDSRANVIYRWLTTGTNEREGAFNLSIATDNNRPTFTDPETGRTARDTMSGKGVYVAWNTGTFATPFEDGRARRIDPTSTSAILVAGSSDGGVNFSTPVLANSNAYYTPNTGAALPTVAFSPAVAKAGAPAGGQLTFTWQTIGGRTTSNDPIPGTAFSDASRPDNGNPNRPAVASGKKRYDVGRTINDGISPPQGAPAGTPDTPGVTNATFDVNLSDLGNLTADSPITDLNFGLGIFHPDPSQLSVEVISPAGDRVVLFGNWMNGLGQKPTAGQTYGLETGGNNGVGVRTFATNPIRANFVGTVFDDEAPRYINDGVLGTRRVSDPYAYNLKTDSVFGGLLSTLYAGKTANDLVGTWTVRILDVRNSGSPPPFQQLTFVELHASGYISNTGFGPDEQLVGTDGLAAAVPVNPNGTGQDIDGTGPLTQPAVSPVVGIAGGTSTAYDRSLGSFSPYAGRLYTAYAAPVYDGATLVDSNIFLRYSDNNGGTWSPAVRVNDDNANDNFSEGRRWQFQPTVAVDDVTGAVVVTWFDARNDASDGRVATYIATSIDGGNTFSARLEGGAFSNQTPSTQAYLNTPKRATDAVTGRQVDLEPIPSNFSTFNVDQNNNPAAPFGPGIRQSLIAFDGRVYPFWSGNNNATGTRIFVGRYPAADNDNQPVRITAGPRVVGGDQGPVTDPVRVNRDGQPFDYNTTFADDGTRLLDGFVVTFDRAVDTSTFDGGDVRVFYRGPATDRNVPATQLPVAEVFALNAVAPDPAFPNLRNATRFFVRLRDPQGAVGTYSYVVGPNIRDRIRTDDPFAPGGVVLGNEMDQDADGNRAETGGGPGQPDDRFAVPASATGGPFVLPFATNSLPLIIPGPHVVGSAAAGRPAGQPDTEDNLVLNAGNDTLDVTFDRDMVPSSFTAANVRRITGPIGDIAGPFTVTPLNVDPITGGARTFRITFARQVLSGGYTVEFGPDPNGNLPRAVAQPRLVLSLPVGATSAAVRFDRDISRAVTAADVVRITGPNGPLAGPFDITGGGRDFTVTFPAVPVAGQYVIEFRDAPDRTDTPLRVPANAAGPVATNLNPVPAVDTNLNAGLATLRGGDRTQLTPETVTTRTYGPPGPSTIPIPSGSTASPAVAEFPINITDDFAVQQLLATNPADRRVIQVRLTVDFPNVPDLVGELVAPDGSTVLLFNRVGTQGQPNQANLTNTLFEDTAGTPISSAAPPFTGPGAFNPEEPFARLVVRPEGPVSSRGTWRLRVTNTGAGAGVIRNFQLTLPFAISGSGLGEAVADRFTAGFRIFTQDPSNPLSRQQWTPVGPASQNATVNPAGFNTGRVTALAVDPSDPSGNTVYAGGATGGVWKTTNFLTTDPVGPDWAPLTDFGPTVTSGGAFGNTLNIGSIAVFGRNNDPTQSVVLVATGEGDTLGEYVQGGGLRTEESPGVGFLLSVDGGRTWRLLDSSVNVDRTTGEYLAISSGQRDHRFVGTVGFRVAIDPTPTPAGELIFYAALSDAPSRTAAQRTGGIYRSNDTGKTWTLVRAGQATDVTLAPGSAQTLNIPDDPNNPNLSPFLQVMYAAFRGEGVFFSPQAPDATSAGGPGALTRVDGRGQNPLFRDFQIIPTRQIPIATFPGQADRTPGGNKGRITLAVPAVTNDVIRNVAYQGWVYALVAGAGQDASGGPIDGLYLSKDFGRNWTRVRLNEFRPPVAAGVFQGGAFGTNDVSAPQSNPFGLDNAPSGGNFAQSIAVDPRNPNIVYLGGLNQATRQPLGGYMRVDVTKLEDAQAVVAYNNSLPNAAPNAAGTNVGGPRLQFGSPPVAADLSRFTGSVVVGPYEDPVYAGPGGNYGIFRPDNLLSVNRGFLNVFRNPARPFVSNATLLFTNVDSSAGAGFQNRGFGAQTQYIDAETETNVHEILTIVDPLTGKTRLITGDDQGVASQVANDDGSTDDAAVGFARAPNKRRNGDLQIGQFFQGAAQPSQLAADIAGVQRLFYATSDNNGYPRSTNTVLQDGGIRDSRFTAPPAPYTSPEGTVGYSGTGVATDQTGTGVAYEFRWPGLGGQGTDFFRVIPRNTYQEGNGLNDGFSRTNGLLQDRSNNGILGGVPDDPLRFSGQWRPDAGSNFAVNPINPNAIVMSANGDNQGVGRLFRTTDRGLNWFVVGETNTVTQALGQGDFAAPGLPGPGLDGTYSAAVAFGAPDPNQPTLLDNFIYAGTNGGRVFVTRTGTAPWLNITGPVGSTFGVGGSLDGSPVQQIVANPRRGSTDLFAVTLRGVYYKANAFDTAVGWQNVTGNLFSLTRAAFGGSGEQVASLKYLTTIAADWRFAIPQDPEDPNSPTFPVLYVGGEGGVFRSADKGTTWDYFPAATTYTDVPSGKTYDIPAGGYLPNVHVTDLDLSLGDIDPANGLPRQSQSGGLNLLLATTYGRGQFAIRLSNQLPPNSFVSGPRVVQLINPNSVGGPSDRFQVVFSGPVDPNTFTAADVALTGPNGAITVQSVTPVGGGTLPTTFDILFQPVAGQAPVNVVIGANPGAGKDVPAVTDLGGNVMNQNGNGTNGESLVDQYRTTIVLNAATNNRLVVAQAPATAVAGESVSVTIEARDADDQIFDGSAPGRPALNGTVTLSPAPGTGAFSPTTVDLVNGRATFQMVFEKAGDQTVRADLTSGGLNANGTDFTVRVRAAAASQFVLDPPDTILTVGLSNPDVPFTIAARDRFGNAAADYAGPVTVAVTGAGGTVPETLNMANGTGTFTGRFTNTGTATVTVSGPDPTNAANTISGSATVSVSSGTAARLEVTAGGGPFVIGNPVTVTVRALDAGGNLADFDSRFTIDFGDPAAVVSPADPVLTDGTATVTVTFGTPGTYTARVTSGALTGQSGPITVLATPPKPKPTTTLPKVTAVGSGGGGSPVVQVVNPDASPLTQFVPFPAGFNGEVDAAGGGFTGGLRVAVADVTGDGVPDYVVGSGPGITAIVQVRDGATGKATNIQPFETFKGGVFVAVGDVTGDGTADVVVTPDLSGGPRVSVYRGGDFRRVANFFGIKDENFRGGARAGVGDVNADGFAEVVISAGFGGGPRISVYDGAALAQGREINPVSDFFLFEEGLRNGAYVAVGDVDGDGFADLIGGAGPGGGPRVLTISGKTLLQSGADAAIGAPLANFFAGDPENRGGVRVTVKNLDNDDLADVVTGAGEGGGSAVTSYAGKTLMEGGTDPLFGFDAFPDFSGGVFVG